MKYSPFRWIAPFDAMPWWAGFAYEDSANRRALIAPLGVNWFIALAFAIALFLRHPRLVLWVAQLQSVQRGITFEGKLYRAQLENYVLREKNARLELENTQTRDRCAVVEKDVKELIHDNLALRSEPAYLRRNDV